MDQSQVKSICPRPIGWLEYTLSQQEIDYLWNRVENKGDSHKAYLIGHIAHSFKLDDRNDWFFNNTLLPLLNRYVEEFINLGEEIPINSGYSPYYLDQWWVNYQHEGDFNPLHIHGSVFSFAIWLKIPTNHADQNESPLAKGINHGGVPRISCFEFGYSDILGTTRNYTYALNSTDPIKMLFFPAKLHHMVYPFYNCKEDRVTISGNIGLDTRPGYPTPNEPSNAVYANNHNNGKL